ncbi:MAG: hypothetical protein HY911_00420 [Desulfobacterales bacterium]|nr:hypothetical protein [Desulfobacterales bacterium]
MTHRRIFLIFLLLAATVSSVPSALADDARPLLAQNESRTDPSPSPTPMPTQGQENAAPDDLQQQIKALHQKVEELEKESEARKALRISEEEKASAEEQVLSAAGREYTLIPAKQLGFEYGMQYSYLSSDLLEDLRNSEGNRLAVERRGNHTFYHTLFLEKGLVNNLSINGTLPFVYKYDERSVDDDREVTDLGDASAGLQYQPFKTGGAWPDMIVILEGSFPTGRSPYKINPETELSTGNGYYATTAGLTFSKTIDPVVPFGSLFYTYAFPTSDTDQIQPGGKVLTEVDAGETLGFSLGMASALSYKTSLNFTYQYAYHTETEYAFTDGTAYESNSWVTSSFSIGAGWRLSPKFSLFVKTAIGLTSDDPDFTFSIRIPVRFNLGD